MNIASLIGPGKVGDQGQGGDFDGQGVKQAGLVGSQVGAHQPNLNDDDDYDDDENNAVAYRSFKSQFPQFDKNGDGKITVQGE